MDFHEMQTTRDFLIAGIREQVRAKEAAIGSHSTGVGKVYFENKMAMLSDFSVWGDLLHEQRGFVFSKPLVGSMEDAFAEAQIFNLSSDEQAVAITFVLCSSFMACWADVHREPESASDSRMSCVTLLSGLKFPESLLLLKHMQCERAWRGLVDAFQQQGCGKSTAACIAVAFLLLFF